MKARNMKLSRFMAIFMSVMMLCAMDFSYALTVEAETNPVKTRVYIRSFDYNKTSELTMKPQGDWLGERYKEAFPEADVLVSTARLSRDDFYNEIDNFFKDADDNDINYVLFSGHGSSDGYVFLHNNFGTKLEDIRKGHLDNIKGKIILMLSGCFTGRYLDENFTGTTFNTFRKEVYAQGDKYSILACGVEESYYTPNATGPSADINGKWTAAFGITTDEYGGYKIAGDKNNDGRLTIEEVYLYGCSKPTSYSSMRWPKKDDTVLMTVPQYSAVFHACDGTFEDGNDYLTINSKDSPTITEVPEPVKDGLTFDGWYTKATGGELVTFPLTLNSNASYWAHWSKDGESNTDRELKKYDKIRIPLRSGNYTDFVVLDPDHTCNVFNKSTMKCDSDEGMFLVSKDAAGTLKYAETIEDVNVWKNTNIKLWCDQYYSLIPKAFRENITDTTITVPEGSSSEKVFIMTKSELQESVGSNLSSYYTGYNWLRKTSSSDDIPGLNGTSNWTLGLSKNNLNAASFGVHPAFNLNITQKDLSYDFEKKVFEVKKLKDNPTEFDPVDKDYVIKKDGLIIYKAQGERDKACDYMNTMAMVPWKLDEPIYYNYMGNLRSLMQPGSYRGIPYANTYDRNFHDIDNVMDAFAEGEDKVRGLECSSAVGYALRAAFDDPGDLVMSSKDDVYHCRSYIADGLHEGSGKMTSVGGGTLVYGDYVTLVGNYGDYVNDDTPDTQKIIPDIIEEANYETGTIYDNVYAKIKPGDALIRHYPLDLSIGSVKSHAQLCTGVELVYGEDGLIDPDKSFVRFTDISAPHNTVLNTTKETTAWTHDDTQKSNIMTFRYMTDEGYVLPVRLDAWMDEPECQHLITEHFESTAGYCKDGYSYDLCSVCNQKINYKQSDGYSNYYVKSFKVKKGKKRFTAKWKKQSKKNRKNFTGYQIRYSRYPSMANSSYAYAKNSAKSKTIKKLNKKTKYYVQVRTYRNVNGKKYFSKKWSAKKVVKTR